jgi:hypothetical protein
MQLWWCFCFFFFNSDCFFFFFYTHFIMFCPLFLILSYHILVPSYFSLLFHSQSPFFCCIIINKYTLNNCYTSSLSYKYHTFFLF